MKVPFFGNDRQFENLREDWLKRAEKTWSTGQYLFGPEVAKLEGRLAQICQRKYCVALGSCTDALTIALSFFDLPQGSRVAVSNFSFLASATPILHNNCTPQFIDIDREKMHPTMEQYRRGLDEKTKALVAVSLFGMNSNLEEVEAYCEEKKLILIEDAAQSFGSVRKGRAAGSFGEASCISFDPTKIIPASSSAGALLTNNEELFKFARAARLHGRDESLEFSRLGGKSLISSVEANLLDLKLDHLQEWIERRNQIASFYFEGLSHIEKIELPFVPQESTHTFHKFVIQTEERDSLFEFLLKKGITPRKHYSKTISDELIFKDVIANTPIAKKVSQQVLSLPLFPELTDSEVNYVIESIKEYYS